MIAFFVANWHLILALILGAYELVIRLIPTVGNYSLLGIIVKLLQWFNDNLNVTKKTTT
jgi:hypothetical protein